MSPSRDTPEEAIIRTLSDDRLLELFGQEALTDWYLPRLPTTPPSAPKAIVIGGQPGAGKTSARKILAPPRDFATVNGDDLRAFHPQFAQIIRHHLQRLAEETAGVSGQFVAASIAWFIKHRFNLTWETTFRSGDALVRDLVQARSAGYEVEVWALAVPGPVSLEATVARWVAEVQSKGVGRPVSLAGHDEPFESAPGLLRRIAAELPDVALYVVDRNGNALHTPGGTDSPDRALVAGRHLTDEMATELRLQVERTRAAVLALPPGAGGEGALSILDIVTERIDRDTAGTNPG